MPVVSGAGNLFKPTSHRVTRRDSVNPDALVGVFCGRDPREVRQGRLGDVVRRAVGEDTLAGNLGRELEDWFEQLTLDTFTIAPVRPSSTRYLINCCEPAKRQPTHNTHPPLSADTKLVPNTTSQSSSLMSARLWLRSTPALFTRMLGCAP